MAITIDFPYTGASSWPAVSTVTVSRPGNPSFTGMVIAGVIVGRDGSHASPPVIIPPFGFELDYLGDYSTDPFPSVFAIYHKIMDGSTFQPSSYVWGVTPNRTLNVQMIAARDAGYIRVAANTDYTGSPGDPQHVRDEALILTGTQTNLEKTLYWMGAVSFGPIAELGMDEYFHSLISSNDLYSTRLWPAGTYYLVIFPFDGGGWDTSQQYATLRIVRTAEVHSMGRRSTSSSPPDVFGNTPATAGTITDPPIGNTTYTSDFTGFTQDPSEPTELADDWSSDATLQYSGWVKLVLTTPMYLSFDTYGSAMVDTILALYSFLPDSTSRYDYLNDDTREYPYFSSSPFSGNIGFWPAFSTNAGIFRVQFDYYAQQAFAASSDLVPAAGEFYTMSGDAGSPRRVGVHLTLGTAVTVTLDWPYEPGTVLVNGSADGVSEVDPTTGVIRIAPRPGGTYTVTYLAAGTNPLGSPGVTATAERSIALGNGLAPFGS